MTIQEGRARRRPALGLWETLSMPAGPSGIAFGSRVQTRRGEVLIETLSAGEEVLTGRGGFSHVRSVAVRRAVDPGQVAVRPVSVRIRRDAFGPMRPHHDLIVAPGQVLHTDDGPASASSLLNGRTVVRDRKPAPPMVSVELDAAETLIVDGVSVEGMRS